MKPFTVIQCDGSYKTYVGKPTLEELQEFVGGYIEHVSVRWHGRKITAYVNEEGKLLNLGFNPKATALMNNTRDEPYEDLSQDPPNLPWERDWIAGPMVVMSEP